MSSSSTFTISAEGGLIKSNKFGRTTLLTVNAHTGLLKRIQSLTFLLADGSNKDVDLAAAGMSVAKVLSVEPGAEDNFGDDSSGGVTITINGATPGIVLRNRSFVFMVDATISSLNIANGSGSEVSVQVLLAGE